MDAVLIKIFATALALSQAATRPDGVKTQFDPIRDRAEVTQLLQAGCAHVRKVFDIEDINLDDLIATAMNDPEAVGAEIKAFRGLKFDDLLAAYQVFCQNKKVAHSPVDIGEVISFYDRTVSDLPDAAKLKNVKQAGLSVVLDRKGGRFAELGESSQRRIWVPLDDIPDYVKLAFVAAEDKRFFQHKGIDVHGLIRAFVGNLARPGRPQGGSTITQQVAKNLLVGDDVSYERKIREIIVASRLEHVFSKPEILGLYLNSIYLGRGSWGVEMAAHSYFGKPAKALTLAEGALLAGMTKGPTYFSSDRHPDRARERLSYVLGRMQEDGAISTDQMKRALAQVIPLVKYDQARRDTGFYFVDHVAREAKTLAGIDTLAGSSYTVHSTIQPDLQRATEIALQEGLARYELDAGRVQFKGPETNLSDAIQHIEAAREGGRSPERLRTGAPTGQAPAWRQALLSARLPLYNVHWPTGVIVAPAGGKSDGVVRVGLGDGRILPLTVKDSVIRRSLKLHDVVFVHVAEDKKKSDARAELRVRPVVQGAALVLDNKTGNILAMAGGFSHSLSQFNRTTQAKRQPGSTLKPITYFAALKAGLQPNTLVLDEPITFAPIGTSGPKQEKDYWTPRNDGNSTSGAITLRRALENSRNLATAHLLDGGIAKAPEDSLDGVCAVAMKARLYAQCAHYYPFVLGAQPVRMIDLAAFYSAIANEGMRPSPHTIESIEQNGEVIYRSAASPVEIGVGDAANFYQLKTMLQGVVARGTARSIAHLAPYVAGKTGTTDDANDGWFVGFTNDVTVVVWVGYDNADGQRRTLGDGETGARVALPIFEPIIEAVWADYASRGVLAPPSPRAQRQLADLPIDLNSGARERRGRDGGFIEHFHLNSQGEVDDTRYRLVSDGEPQPSRSEKRVREGHKARAASIRVVKVRRTTARVAEAQPQVQQAPFGALFWGWGGIQQPYTRRAEFNYTWGSWGGRY
jgi:penicillin-binding protein 1A